MSEMRSNFPPRTVGGKKNHTLHTDAMYVLHLNPYKSLKYAAFGPLYARGCMILFATVLCIFSTCVGSNVIASGQKSLFSAKPHEEGRLHFVRQVYVCHSTAVNKCVVDQESLHPIR